MMTETEGPLFPHTVAGSPVPSLIYLLTKYLTFLLVKGIMLTGLCFAFIVNGVFFTIIAILIWIPSWIYESLVELLGDTNGTPRPPQPEFSIPVHREDDNSDLELDEMDYPMVDIIPYEPRIAKGE
jgi:hypothetical protein